MASGNADDEADLSIKLEPKLLDDLNGDWVVPPCPAREDGQHCEHWYDGEECCSCGDPEDEDVLLLMSEDD